jgi:hypothetical protein
VAARDGASDRGFLPEGRHRVLEGQEHNVAPEAMAPALEEFFAG